jgi:hypothetical protein
LWLQVDGSYGGITGTFFVTLNNYLITDIESIPVSQDDFNVSIYPNPTSRSFTLHIEDPGNDGVLIEVFDVSGKLILNRKYNNVTAPFSEELTLDKTNKGMFLVRIITNRSLINKKLLVN